MHLQVPKVSSGLVSRQRLYPAVCRDRANSTQLSFRPYPCGLEHLRRCPSKIAELVKQTDLDCSDALLTPLWQERTFMKPSIFLQAPTLTSDEAATLPGVVWIAAEERQQSWRMRRGNLSPAYTSRWDQLPVVQA